MNTHVSELLPRDRVMAKIGPGYRGELHFAGLMAEATFFMGGALLLLRDVQLWEWLLVPAGLLFANAVEWFVHRGPLHHPTPPRMLYHRHTLLHHAAFTADEMSIRSWRELRVVLFPLFALPLLQVVVSPVVGLVWWLAGRNAAALFIFTATFYYLLYELLHLAYHLPLDHPVARLAIIKRLKRHHQRHHNPRRMTAGNFNVSIPFFDWVMGSILKDEVPGPRAAS